MADGFELALCSQVNSCLSHIEHGIGFVAAVCFKDCVLWIYLMNRFLLALQGIPPENLNRSRKSGKSRVSVSGVYTSIQV